MPRNRNEPKSDPRPAVPLKVSKDTQRSVQYGAVIYHETQQQFMDRAVRDFFRSNAADVARRRQQIEGVSPDSADSD